MPLPLIPKFSLKTRVALATGAVFIGFISALALLTQRHFETEFRNSLYRQQFALVSALANSIDDKLRITHGALIASASTLPHAVLADSDKAQRFLDQQTALLSIFDNGLFLVAGNGRIIAESPFRAGRRGRDLSFREFIQVTTATKEPYISKPFLTAYAPAQPAVVMTAPVLDEKGRLIGILEGSFNLLGRNILADLGKIKVGDTGYIALSDRARLMIMHSDPKRIMTPTAEPGQNPLYDQAIAGFEGSAQTQTSSGIVTYTSYRHLNTVDWLLSASLPVAEAEAPLRKAQTYAIAASTGGALVVLLIVWLVMKKVLSPLLSLTRHVQDLPAKKGRDRLLNLKTGGEIGTLVNAFNTLVETLDQQQQIMVEEEERYRSLTEMSTDWYWEQGPDHRFSLMSSGLAKTRVQTNVGKARWELPIVGVSEAQWQAHRELLDRHEPFKDFIYQIKTVGGDLRTFSISGAPFFGPDGEFRGYRGIGSDITERQSAERQIEFLAFHDTLTGLPNRLLMKDRCEQAIAQAEREGHKVALLYLDLDNFKTINDTLGHDAGDTLLRQVAARLQECVRDTDTISRQGGDEFLVVLRDLPDAEAVAAIMLKISERLQEPFLAGGHETSTSASMGAAIFPDDGPDFETLRRQADMAMYRAKDAGRNAYRFFDEAMNVEATEHLVLRNGLRRALERGEFVLNYQPQLDLANGAVVGVEALLRWNHPELGMVAPARFIPVAEESGLIVPIGDWVLHEACRQAARWQSAGLPPITMAVNFSAVQFKRGDVEQSVRRALEQSGLAPQWLELELTESILIQNVENVLASVKRLKLLGVKLSIDDFGTGYSSLSYLKRFDIDKLKIDQSFVRDLATDPEDAAIVRAIIQMARSLNLRTIAEGVETAEMMWQLRSFQCDEAQGFHFARPMAAAEMANYLAKARPAQGPSA